MQNYITQVDGHLEKALEELVRFILAMPRAHVGSLTLAQICAIPGAPHGLYFMFDASGALWYVGSAGSRTFGTRFSAHFDQQEFAILNTVPRKILKAGLEKTYEAALRRGLDLHVCMLGIPLETGPVKLENALRYLMAPLLNAESRPVVRNMAVSSLLGPRVKRTRRRATPA